MTERTYTLAEIAKAFGCSRQAVQQRAQHARWPFTEQPVRGGKQRLYQLVDLPAQVQAQLVMQQARAEGLSAASANAQTYNRDALWERAARKTQVLRDRGIERAAIVQQTLRLTQHGQNFGQAAELVAHAHGIPARNIHNWYYGVNGQPGARHFEDCDWAAALIPGYNGQRKRNEIPPDAWDWFSAYWLTRRAPTINDSYRRLLEVARTKSWSTLPSARTFARRVHTDIAASTRILLREGEAALAQLYPHQRRDKTVFTAGEAVTGDGLKFDRLWVEWPDGEVLNTSTGWFWADLYSNKILAYRLAKTENTDMFRLATYDLTGICRPDHCWIDNTVVAANKAMTGRAANRHRFHDRPDDAFGLLLCIGMDVHFTNPDKVLGNPGSKPIERAFGIGGIHEMVATSPRLKDKGYSSATAIPYELFAAIVAEEIQRYNAREKRRTDVCRGTLSFDQAFEQSFRTATVTRLSDSQRQLLLLMPEVVRATSDRGELRLKAGASRIGQHRYWSEFLTEFKGHSLVAYYDPEKLDQAVTVYTLDGRQLGNADHLPGTAFNDTHAGREWGKNKARYTKANKLAAKAQQRMDALEVAAMYPQPEQPPSVPAPGVVRGNFGQKRNAENGQILERAAGHDTELTEHNRNFDRLMRDLMEQKKAQIL